MTVLIVPNLYYTQASSPKEHWQSWLENTVEDALSITHPQRKPLDLEGWSKEIIQTLEQAKKPTWIIANGEGCLAVAHASASHAYLIEGAMLVMPSPYSHINDLPTPANYPLELCSQTLPFPSVVVLRKDEKQSLAAEQQHWAKQWESKIVHIAPNHPTHPTPSSQTWPWALEFFEHFRAHHESLNFLQTMRKNTSSRLRSRKQYDENVMNKQHSFMVH
ncbi:MAG: alpha/beta hydrolase [Pseudomonadota bacterium]